MWKSKLLCSCLCALIALAQSDVQESKIVNITQGPVRGYKDPNHGIFTFYSIPYATVPTGPNKFKAPLPPPVWSQPFEAKNKDIICPQAPDPVNGYLSRNVMQENCLIANVYIPDTEETNLPVVVYVHGGAYQVGSGTAFEHQELVAEHNIIVVSFNYRLGVHGFLCLGTEDVPGNAGMKDQVELLRWVNRNIASFGGNPDDVTIAGYSAGSASADLLMLSKSTEGLFNKVIPESGVSTSVFTIQSEPLESAKWFAKLHNFESLDNVYALEQFYKTASFEVLTNYPFYDSKDSTFVFSPCIEEASAEAFLTESPMDILKNDDYKKVPILHGFANMEGLIRIDLFELWKSKMDEKISDFFPADLKFDSETQKEEVAKTVKEFYFGENPVGNENVLAYIDYFTDVMFAYSTLRSIRIMVENGHDQIYLYEYSFVDENTPAIPYTSTKGASHCAQTEAITGQLWGPVSDSYKPTEELKKVSSTLRQLWANFIKTGKPVPEGSSLPAWPAVRSNWSPHMSLSNTLELRGSLLERRARFWDDIYAKHYRIPLPPRAY